MVENRKTLCSGLQNIPISGEETLLYLGLRGKTATMGMKRRLIVWGRGEWIGLLGGQC